MEKTSTEITSTRKKRPLGNKVHLERVGKKGHESRKIGPQHPNKRLFAYNIFTSTNRTPGLISRTFGRNNQSLETAHANCKRLTTTSKAVFTHIWPTLPQTTSSCCGHAVAKEDEESCYSDTEATIATVQWICRWRSWPKGLYGRSWPQHPSLMLLTTDVNMTLQIVEHYTSLAHRLQILTFGHSDAQTWAPDCSNVKH